MLYKSLCQTRERHWILLMRIGHHWRAKHQSNKTDWEESLKALQNTLSESKHSVIWSQHDQNTVQELASKLRKCDEDMNMSRK